MLDYTCNHCDANFELASDVSDEELRCPECDSDDVSVVIEDEEDEDEDDTGYSEDTKGDDQLEDFREARNRNCEVGHPW